MHRLLHHRSRVTFLRTLILTFCTLVLTLDIAIAGERGRAAFPSAGLMPKAEIGALRFLEEHPEYDGRGVVVAIFDTGVDPGAAGLATTPDGRPKILDLVDASGSGDVDTSTVREAKGGELVGLTGRTLFVPSTWNNPSEEYHLGLKAGFELFPSGLTARLRAERAEAWAEQQRPLEASLRRALTEWDSANPQPDREARKAKADLEQRLEQLLALPVSCPYPGPIFDCLVFYDGNVWRAVIDTDQDGDLAEERLLTDFRRERGFASFGDETMLNFAVNIYQEGNLLSIVTDSGMHGTHVAGIVAAYYPDQPELNGVAPGAQLVSVKIGDARLDGMETSTGFSRGLQVVRDQGCDVINLSYGEPTTLPNRAWLSELLSAAVREDGVVFVSSAGNAGPALSTVGAPGGTTSALIGVGAYVSPAMMTAGYSMRDSLAETHYTWSSRGPTYDGDLGVNISAPGGAISPVPNWTLQRSMLANGTSMASPNTAGAVALILSGLKAEQIPADPTLIRQALESTARWLTAVEVFAQGHGLIQVGPAFEYCQQFGATHTTSPAVEITLPRLQGARGVYLREPDSQLRPLETSVRVKPLFRKGDSNHAKVEFERRYRMEATAPWVQTADHLLLVHGGRSFDIRVDPTELASGAHFAEILGFDEALPGAGPAFRVPVTVLRPEPRNGLATEAYRETLLLEPAQIERRFLVPPAGATWAELKIRAHDLQAPVRLALHTLQTLPGKPHTATESLRFISLDALAEQSLVFSVAAGRTLEICLASYWSEMSPGEFTFTLTYHGLVPSPDNVLLDAAARICRVDVANPLAEARLQPSAKLDAVWQTVHPSAARIRPLGRERDGLPEGGQLHELVLTYPFTLKAETTVTPRFPGLNGRLYDGEFGSQLYRILDAQDRLVVVDDGWQPGSRSLKQGDYRLQLHLTHPSANRLESLESLPLILERQLGSPITVVAHAHPDEALTGGPTFGSRPLARGDLTTFWLSAPALDQLSPHGQPGDLLVGRIRYESSRDAPSYPLVCPLPPAPSAKTNVAAEKEKEIRTVQERLQEDLRDWQIEQLARLTPEDQEAVQGLEAKLLEADPDYLPVYVERLHRVDNDRRKQRLRSVVEAADALLSRIDTNALTAWFGVRRTPVTPAEKEEQAEMEEEKQALIDALYRMGRALAWMELDELAAEESADPDAETAPTVEPPLPADEVEELFEATWKELERWIDPQDESVALLTIRREWRHQRLGEALELLQEQIQHHPTDRKLLRKRIRLLRALGWEEWAQREEEALLLRFPTAEPVF